MMKLFDTAETTILEINFNFINHYITSFVTLLKLPFFSCNLFHIIATKHSDYDYEMKLTINRVQKFLKKRETMFSTA